LSDEQHMELMNEMFKLYAELKGAE
jgi:hypothetical protein